MNDRDINTVSQKFEKARELFKQAQETGHTLDWMRCVEAYATLAAEGWGCQLDPEIAAHETIVRAGTRMALVGVQR